MKNSDLSITDSFWNFIEANVPNYHEREDVLHQGELQLFIDGHESTVQGITREEAFCCVTKSCTAFLPKLSQLLQPGTP